MSLLAAVALAGGVLLPAAPPIDPLLEVRQCGEPVRLADGTIRRRADVLAAFRRLHPCPVTGRHDGACPRWAINHVVPLAKGGCDAVSNLQWLPVEIKACSSPYCVDRWERTYWGAPYGVVVFPSAAAASAP